MVFSKQQLWCYVLITYYYWSFFFFYSTRYSAKILEAPPLDDQTADEVKYKVQLLDENNEGMEEYIKNMDRKDIK